MATGPCPGLRPDGSQRGLLVNDPPRGTPGTLGPFLEATLSGRGCWAWRQPSSAAPAWCWLPWPWPISWDGPSGPALTADRRQRPPAPGGLRCGRHDPRAGGRGCRRLGERDTDAPVRAGHQRDAQVEELGPGRLPTSASSVLRCGPLVLGGLALTVFRRRALLTPSLEHGSPGPVSAPHAPTHTDNPRQRSKTGVMRTVPLGESRPVNRRRWRHCSSPSWSSALGWRCRRHEHRPARAHRHRRWHCRGRHHPDRGPVGRRDRTPQVGRRPTRRKHDGGQGA